jgi:RNA polymerase sigma-70 factor (ECF subfamily)
VDAQKHLIEFQLRHSEEAFAALFASAYAPVRRYFLLRGMDTATAEELAQNVFLIVYQRAGDVREPALFSGWLFAIARNELLQHWRRSQTRVSQAPLDAELAERFWQAPEAGNAWRMEAWLNRLEPAERDLAILRFVVELSYEELAVALDAPLGTIKWRLYQLKKKLAQIIEAEEPHLFRSQAKQLG